jgi:hypothetical protein
MDGNRATSPRYEKVSKGDTVRIERRRGTRRREAIGPNLGEYGTPSDLRVRPRMRIGPQDCGVASNRFRGARVLSDPVQNLQNDNGSSK